MPSNSVVTCIHLHHSMYGIVRLHDAEKYSDIVLICMTQCDIVLSLLCYSTSYHIKQTLPMLSCPNYWTNSTHLYRSGSPAGSPLPLLLLPTSGFHPCPDSCSCRFLFAHYSPSYLSRCRVAEPLHVRGSFFWSDCHYSLLLHYDST